MAVSIREQIITALLDVLDALPDVTVERNRDTAVQKFPSLILFTAGHKTERLGPGIDEYVLDLIVEGYVTAEDGAAAHVALNDLYAAAVAAIAVDPTLGGLAVDARETGLAEEYSHDGSRHVAGFALSFDVLYQTAAGDPFNL